jgi:HEAT repeat protein/Leucine-rich repeat (LRR) protein
MNMSQRSVANCALRRRWFQFSLRTLLLFVTAASVGLGWFGSKVYHARERQAAIALLKAHGISIAYDSYDDETEQTKAAAAAPEPTWLRNLLGDDFFDRATMLGASRQADGIDLSPVDVLPDFRQVWLGFRPDPPPPHPGFLEELGGPRQAYVFRSQLNDSALVHLDHLSHLRELYLDDTEVSDAGLDHLSHFPRLRTLSVVGTKITGAGLQHLKALSDLRELNLSETQIDDAGLSALAGLTNLERLTLRGTRISGSGLTNLAGLKNLNSIDLTGTHITDDGLPNLPVLKLSTLVLRDTRMTDRGAECLSKMNHLKALDLSGTLIGDATLAKLKSLSKLESLAIAHTRITNEGLKDVGQLISLKSLDTDGLAVTHAGITNLYSLVNLEGWAIGMSANDDQLVEDGHLRFAVALNRRAPTEVPKLIAFLGDKNPEVRKGAVDRLLEYAWLSRQAMSALLKQGLRDPDPTVRAAAAVAVGNSYDYFRDVVPALVAALDDSSDEVRDAIIESLKWLERAHGSEVISIVVRLGLANRSPQIRRGAVEALERMPYHFVVPDLPEKAGELVGEALQNEDPEVRIQTAEVLGNWGPLAKSGVPVLRKALDDPEQRVRRAAAQALQEIAPANATTKTTPSGN